MLWWCSILMATSSDESELEFAPDCVKTCGAADAQRLQFDPARHAVFSDGDFSDGDFSGAEAAGTAAQPAPAMVNATRQGSYSRDDVSSARVCFSLNLLACLDKDFQNVCRMTYRARRAVTAVVTLAGHRDRECDRDRSSCTQQSLTSKTPTQTQTNKGLLRFRP